MQLRSNLKTGSDKGASNQEKAPDKKKAPPGRMANGKKPTGVQKKTPAPSKAKAKAKAKPKPKPKPKGKAKADPVQKPVRTRQQAKKLEEAAKAQKQQQQQEEDDAATTEKKKKATGQGKGKGKSASNRDLNRNTRETSTSSSILSTRPETEFNELEAQFNPTKNNEATLENSDRETRESSFLSTKSDASLARMEAEIQAAEGTLVKFWLKPYFQVYDPAAATSSKGRDALSPRSAGVRKKEKKSWRGHALPPFGRPFWQRSKKEGGRLELLLPMLVTEEENKDVGFAAKYDGMMGHVMGFYDRTTPGTGGNGGDKGGGDNGNGGGGGGDGGGENSAGEGSANQGKGLGKDAHNRKGGKKNPVEVSSEISESSDDGDLEEEEGEQGE
ncbi:MAG: hypothetical protein Q9168_003513 [Polycauliona sp. 1 TL-2023]